MSLTWARWSNDLLVVTVLTYAVAMLGYAAELAFGRTGVVRRGAVVSARVSEPARELVGAGVGGAASIWSEAPATTTAGSAAAAPTGPVHPELVEGARGRRLGRIAVSLTLLGWSAHLGSVVTRGLAAGRVPWGNMYEFSCAITLAAVTAFLLVLSRRPVRYLGAFVLLPVVLTLGLAGTVLYAKAEALQPALQSYWLKIHVTAAIIAWGTFLVGAVQTGLYLAAARWEKKVSLAGLPVAEGGGGGALPKGGGIVRRLPSAAALDTAAYRTIAFAFPIWTFAVIAGAVWAEAAGGRYWGWDPKETWSFITWVIYAGYLHARATAGWSGKKAAAISLLAFSALTIDYYVVNLVVSGLHSYAGTQL